jgi:hypothetical protein
VFGSGNVAAYLSSIQISGVEVYRQVISGEEFCLKLKQCDIKIVHIIVIQFEAVHVDSYIHHVEPLTFVAEM